MRSWFLICSAIVALPAAASSLSDEFTVNQTDETPSNPRAGSVSDTLNGSIDVADRWTIDLGASLTEEGKTAAARRGQFPNSGSIVSAFTAGVDFEVDDHWNLSLSGELSPESAQSSGTSVFVGRNPTTLQLIFADARLVAKSAQDALGLEVSYDTAGESNLEWIFSGGATLTHFSTDQRVTTVRLGTQLLSGPELLVECRNGTIQCSRALRTVLREQPADLDSARLSAGVTATVYRDTDLSLGVDTYLYEQDPATVGYFSLATSGRTINLGGNGVPIAPLRVLVKPEITQRFGAFSVKLAGQVGRYVPGLGGSTGSLGLKLQYKFTKWFRAWVTGTGQRDTDAQGSETKSASLALGLGVKF